MQLRVARLCLDCEEVHDRLQCPVCASETFTYLTRWVPAPEHERPAPSSSPDAEVYRQLVSGGAPRGRRSRALRGGALAIAALGVIGWWFQNGRSKDAGAKPSPPEI